MKSVYCAVRTEALNKAVCTSSLKGQCPVLILVFFTINVMEIW